MAADWLLPVATIAKEKQEVTTTFSGQKRRGLNRNASIC